MPQCKYCNKKGLFLSLSEEGLCRECLAVVTLNVQERVRVIKSSAEVAEKSKNLKTKLSRVSLMREHLEELLKYEQMNISTITPPPSSVLATLEKDRQTMVLEAVEEQVGDALAKAELATTPKSSVTQASKALLAIGEAEQEVEGSAKLAELRKRVTDYIHDRTLSAYLDAAHKAEFKGQLKKALDAYQEALYFLRTDDIDDAKQGGQITELEKKIEELQTQIR